MDGASAHLLAKLPAGPRNLARAKLGEFIQVDLRIPHLGRLHEFVPGDLMSLICGGARHHAGKSRLGAFGRLVVEIAAVYALDYGLLLFGIGELEIGAKASGDRERLRLRLIFRRRTGGLPGFIAPDAEWAGIRRLRGTFGAEEALGDVPPAFSKLGGAEGHVDVVGIVEEHVVISVGVAVGGGAALAASCCGRFQRVWLENPVTNVDHVNVLLDDDVAGKRAIVDPVAEAALGRRGVEPCWPLDITGKIVSFSTNNLTERPIMDAPDHFDEWRAIANLESDI